jgi:E3 ubiquitin-protein ligase DRIP
LFPAKAEVDAFEAPTITLPAKRKERSISSLVETPKMATQSTLTGRRTKAARRAITSQTFSLGKLPNKYEDCDQKTEEASPPKSTKMTTSANKKQVVLMYSQHIISYASLVPIVL